MRNHHHSPSLYQRQRARTRPVPRLLGAVIVACAGAAYAADAPSSDAAAAPSAGISPFFDEATLKLNARSFSGSQYVEDVVRRNAWTLNFQLDYESGFTSGPVGFGADVSPFAGIKLEGSENTGEFAYIRRDGSQDARSWVYLGKYEIKARVGDTVAKYGLQAIATPIVEGRNNRGLLPTFRGVTLSSQVTPVLGVEAGSLDAVMARGRSYLQGLATDYGGVAIDRLTYAGANWDYSSSGNLSVYVDNATNVWNQLYAGLSNAGGDPATMKWTGCASFYLTRDQGARREGRIDSKVYGLSMSATHRAYTAVLSYQRIASDQFFDFVAEGGGSLPVSFVTDYNAPHEQAVQLRGVIDGQALGAPGFQVMAWASRGWGADATALAGVYAADDSALHTLYWKNGQPVHGRHGELGINPSYLVQDGVFKNARFRFFAAIHRATAFYSDNKSRDYRLFVDMPLKLF